MSTELHPIVEKVRRWVVPIDSNTPILNFEKSQGARLWDDAMGKHVIDFASHYCSLPLGYNHPGFHEPEYERELLEVSRIKIANLDVLTPNYLAFLEKFIEVVGTKAFVKYFFVDGGALAIENAMKAAFDWKIHRNMQHGKGERGQEILHFREAFHGRSGYTLSVTNTADPNKTKYFPKFPWPRVSNPKVLFPLEGENLQRTEEAERADDIAAILIEPIQSEGGDNHFRPEFLRFLRNMADEHECLLIFDEVQTGMGMTGDAWAFQTLGVQPDIVCFAKKAQIGGFMSTARLLQEPKNVFTVPSRISSTWGASLVDMVRCRKYLEIIQKENLFPNAKKMGALIVEGLEDIARRTELISNVRNLGLLIAFDVMDPGGRGKFVDTLYSNGLMVLMCGERSIRFRPHLNVTEDVIAEALEIFERTLVAQEVPAAHSS